MWAVLLRRIGTAGLSGLVGVGLAACAPRGPGATLEAYADALELGDVDRAWALTAPAYRDETERAHFEAAHATPESREAAAARARAAAAEHRLVAEPRHGRGPAAHRTEAGWRVVPDAAVSAEGPEAPGPDAAGGPSDPEALLRAFVDHARAGEMAAVLPLLAAPLRTRYDAERLAEDHAAAEGLEGLLDAMEAALAAGGLVVDGEGARLPIGGGRSVRLVREGEGWRIAALR
jgi:hypothetical protein